MCEKSTWPFGPTSFRSIVNRVKREPPRAQQWYARERFLRRCRLPSLPQALVTSAWLQFLAISTMSGRDEANEGKPSQCSPSKLVREGAKSSEPEGHFSEQDQFVSDQHDQRSAVPHSDQPSQTPSNPPSYSLIFGSLPYAKGSRNKFAGELFDAALIGTILGPLYSIFTAPPTSTINSGFANPAEYIRFILSRFILHSAKLFSAASVVFGLLSTSGIDYRRFEDIFGYLRWEEDDVRSDRRAERSCIIGCIGGAVSGAIVSRMRLLPISLTTWMIFGASWGTILSNGISANIAQLKAELERKKKMRHERLRKAC